MREVFVEGLTEEEPYISTKEAHMFSIMCTPLADLTQEKPYISTKEAYVLCIMCTPVVCAYPWQTSQGKPPIFPLKKAI